MYWRDFNGTVPYDALSAEDNLYIGQVTENRGLLPGTFYPESRSVVTMAHDLKILVNDPLNIKVIIIDFDEVFLGTPCFSSYVLQRQIYSIGLLLTSIHFEVQH